MVISDDSSSNLLMSTMNINNIYKELQLIDEFHADFHPTVESELRKTKLINLINNETIQKHTV